MPAEIKTAFGSVSPETAKKIAKEVAIARKLEDAASTNDRLSTYYQNLASKRLRDASTMAGMDSMITGLAIGDQTEISTLKSDLPGNKNMISMKATAVNLPRKNPKEVVNDVRSPAEARVSRGFGKSLASLIDRFSDETAANIARDAATKVVTLPPKGLFGKMLHAISGKGAREIKNVDLTVRSQVHDKVKPQVRSQVLGKISEGALKTAVDIVESNPEINSFLEENAHEIKSSYEADVNQAERAYDKARAEVRKLVVHKKTKKGSLTIFLQDEPKFMDKAQPSLYEQFLDEQERARNLPNGGIVHTRGGKIVED